jgi:hypothetical protein
MLQVHTLVACRVVTPCSLVDGRYQRFGTTYRLHLQGVGNHLQHHTISQPGRATPTNVRQPLLSDTERRSRKKLGAFFTVRICVGQNYKSYYLSPRKKNMIIKVQIAIFWAVIKRRLVRGYNSLRKRNVSIFGVY